MKSRQQKSVKKKGSQSYYLNLSSNVTVNVSCGLLISIIIVFTGVVYQQYNYNPLEAKLNETLFSLLRAEAKVSINARNVAVGFGSCQDVIVQSKYVLPSRENTKPEHFFSIATREQLLQVFSYFYQYGAAAERYVSNATLFKELVNIAQNAPNIRHVIGGNAAVMANRFVKEGCNVYLGAQMSDSLSKSFPKSVIISGPKSEHDDIHMLLEYAAGEQWGSFKSPRANRFIIHNDHQNPLLSSLELFSSGIKSFAPHLLVIGGLQMMDNFPMTPEKRNERLTKVQLLMKSIPKQSNIHFEMASFSDKALFKDLVEKIIPFADSLGMNEQELPNLFHVLKYGNISLISDPYPRIAYVLDQMRDIFRFLQKTEETHGRRKLTRLHIHTLAFHALMIEKGSSWKNILSAIAKSVLTANRHTCGSDEIDIKKAKLIMDDSFTTGQTENSKRIYFDTNRPIACWEEDNVEICVAPVLVCTNVLQTGGGGDNISSAGLVLQI